MKLYSFLLVFVLTVIFTAPGLITIGHMGPATILADDHLSDTVVVYQFHRRFRCEECYKLEVAIRESLDQHFTREIDEGTIVFNVVDLDAEGNDFYEKRYDFFYNTVIVAQVRGEKDVRFKNVEEVWSLANDKEKLMEFLRSEVSEYVEGLGSD